MAPRPAAKLPAELGSLSAGEAPRRGRQVRRKKGDDVEGVVELAMGISPQRHGGVPPEGLHQGPVELADVGGGVPPGVAPDE